jgi:hypothetical protein
MIAPALFQLVDFEIVAAALGRHHVIRVEVPPGPLWAEVASHLMNSTNGRVPTSLDSVFTVVAVRDIHVAADTLIATLVKETRELCPGNKWMNTGTSYDVRTLRVKDFSNSWTTPTVKPDLDWDSFGCLLARPSRGADHN